MRNLRRIARIEAIRDAPLVREHEFASAIFGPALHQLFVGYVARAVAVIEAGETGHDQEEEDDEHDYDPRARDNG
jgi:hypothetical protein